jgi:hypothetical protein
VSRAHRWVEKAKAVLPVACMTGGRPYLAGDEDPRESPAETNWASRLRAISGKIGGRDGSVSAPGGLLCKEMEWGGTGGAGTIEETAPAEATGVGDDDCFWSFCCYARLVGDGGSAVVRSGVTSGLYIAGARRFRGFPWKPGQRRP